MFSFLSFQNLSHYNHLTKELQLLIKSGNSKLRPKSLASANRVAARYEKISSSQEQEIKHICKLLAHNALQNPK